MKLMFTTLTIDNNFFIQIRHKYRTQNNLMCDIVYLFLTETITKETKQDKEQIKKNFCYIHRSSFQRGPQKTMTVLKNKKFIFGS
jgi:hypothetical protein